MTLKDVKITLSKHAGFCEGVQKAYEMITDAVSDPKVKKPIYVLGSLVHNADVVRSLEEMGVRKIHVDRNLFKKLKRMSAKGAAPAVGQGFASGEKIGTLVITAHGMGPAIYEFCQGERIDLVDATCPRVVKVQRLAKFFSDKLGKLVIIGDKGHKETKGIKEWSKNTALVAEKIGDLKKLKLKSVKNITVLFQTTQDLDLAEVVSSFMHNFCPNAKILNTICLATNQRQNEVKRLAKSNDAVIIIGSPESANSARLWEIAKRINSKSYFIEHANQIRKEWLENIERIGVTAGASTPHWVINEIVEYLERV
jgi:(E)-4-hydroxy-3-methyl-but-2-enyl pyrophosphate reductase